MEQQEPVINWLPQRWAKPNALSQREKNRLHGQALNRMVREIHRASVKAGRWSEPEKGGAEPLSVEGVLLTCVSDLAEAAAGHANARMDGDLPSRSRTEVRLADCVVRICDLAGELGLDLGGAVADRL